MRSATRKRIGRDPEYLAWLHELPCSIGGHRVGWLDYPNRMEAAHIGPRGLSTKVPDKQAIPLCSRHHEELHKIGPKKFWDLHGLDPESVISALKAKYDRINNKETTC